MTNHAHQILAQTLSDTLARLAFMFMDDEPAAAASGGPWLEGEISYRGSASGGLLLRCPRRFAVRLAANLLGTEADQVMAEMGAEDSLREFLNVLCGQLVTNLHGTREVFSLTMPRLRHVAAPPGPGAGDCTIRLHVEGEPLELTYLPPVACGATP